MTGQAMESSAESAAIAVTGVRWFCWLVQSILPSGSSVLQRLMRNSS